jgi:hypothetical protein
MGYSTYKPDWAVTNPISFTSYNPMIRDKVTLDTYTINVKDYDANGKEIGEHMELIITHNSLMGYYQRYLMPYGVSVHFTPYPTQDGAVVKCTLQKNDTNLCLEALGEATVGNATTEIAANHLTNTAENRAFDRAMIRFLCLDLNEYGGKAYSSSDDIKGTLKATEKKAETEEPAKEPVEEEPSWYNTPVKPPVQENKQPDKKTETKEPQPVQTQQQGKPSSQQKTDLFKEDRLKAAKVIYSDEEYEKMLDTKFMLSQSPFNGLTFRKMIEKVKAYEEPAGKALRTYIMYRPAQTSEIGVWKCLISYLCQKTDLLTIYPTAAGVFLKYAKEEKNK